MLEEESHRSSTQSFTEESEDRISQLPDCLLVHILSFFSLDEAVRTCTLSKRWQFIWMGILKVDFRKLRSKDKRIEYGVGKRLAINNYLKKLSVLLPYGDFLHSDLDQWIHLAIKNNVKCIKLDFYRPSGKYNEIDVNEEDDNHEENNEESDDEESDEEFGEESDDEESDEEVGEESDDEESDDEESDEEIEEKIDEIYVLPEELYSYSSLTKLTLRKCVLTPQGIITWGSLKSLRVVEVKLSDSLMEKILSGCPVLEFMELVMCSGLNNLNIYSPNLTTLEIIGYNDQLPNISAPHLRNLLIENDGYNKQLFNGDENGEESEYFMLKDLSSIVVAKIDTCCNLSTSSRSTMNRMKHIIFSLKSVKTIELSEEYLPVISLLEVEGWKFPLFIQLRCLILSVWTDEMSTIPGILALLRSSPNLEALEIDMDQHKQDISSDESGVSLHNYDTDLVASHLKTVKIEFYGRDFINEYMLTLVPILLKSAQALEEMTIIVESNQHESNKIVERLHTFPRASSKAVIVPCS